MFGLRRCPCTLCKKTVMPWQQSRTIKRHLQRDAEALELANSNHVENDAREFSLDETLPDNYISAVDTRETQEIKSDDLCSYAQYDGGGDWYGSEASDSLSDQHQPPVHQFALDDFEPLSAPFSQRNSPEHSTIWHEDDESTLSVSDSSPEGSDSNSEAPDIRQDPSFV
ncbi:hypothetical protein JB92DRAFT_3143969 [Gautieria morchelliformis]|nr:hypothetical protein JB92DRAFT_3143969 [Gautieria morchelliformis]